MSNICWFHLLKWEDLLILCISFFTKHNFEDVAVGPNGRDLLHSSA